MTLAVKLHQRPDVQTEQTAAAFFSILSNLTNSNRQQATMTCSPMGMSR